MKPPIWIELYGPRSIQDMNPLRLDQQNLFVVLFQKRQETCDNKLETETEMKFSARGIKNTVLLEQEPQYML